MELKGSEILTGAEIVIRSLQKEGVDTIFGYPGGAVLHIYDALHQQKDVEHILVRHEQAATHAADGYARATGRPGVVLVTSGPGATNAITGIATAYMDSVPLVVISGQVPSPLIGTDAFQEVDMVGISRPIVKHNFLVQDVKDLAETIKKAFYVATEGRPGPVVVDIPKDVTAQKTQFNYDKAVEMRSFCPVQEAHAGQVRKALMALTQTKRPIFYTGGGIILDDASQELIKLVQHFNFPITNTLMGLGGYPSTDKQFVGMLGMHGTYEANLAMHNADLVIAIGARFDDRVTGKLERFCPYAKIIHIDAESANIAKIVPVHIPIVGSATQVLGELNKMVAQENVQVPNIDDWWQQIDTWRSKQCMVYSDSDSVIKPQKVVEMIYRITKGDAYITSDVGQHQMWAAQYYPFDKPRRWINSGGLGTMGFGFPAAMGVKKAFPNEQVVCITGEGSIQMMLQEISTCKQYNIPVKIINLNNGYLGMVRQWQEFFYKGRYAMSYMESLPDFVKLVESYEQVGIRIDKPADLQGKLEQAFAINDKLVFVDVLVDAEENVFPMMPSGGCQDEMILFQPEDTQQ